MNAVQICIANLNVLPIQSNIYKILNRKYGKIPFDVYKNKQDSWGLGLIQGELNPIKNLLLMLKH